MGSDLERDVAAIRSKLEAVHEELVRFAERSNQQHLSSILDGCRVDYGRAILGYALDEIEGGLEANMVGDCQMKAVCKALFSDLLKGNLHHIKAGGISEEAIGGARSKMEDMRRKAPREECARCFSEAGRLLEKQVDLFRSLRVYRDPDIERGSIEDLDEEGAVRGLLDPLGSGQRLQIMKALALETKSFSALSKLTGLRGGNLLFHLQKLSEARMIIQRHERGDYMITARGYKALQGISELYSDLFDLGAGEEREVSPPPARI
jgi:DNA-binding transcriptional ArsR family regulator